MGISFCHFMKQKWEWRDGKGWDKMGKMWVRGKALEKKEVWREWGMGRGGKKRGK